MGKRLKTNRLCKFFPLSLFLYIYIVALRIIFLFVSSRSLYECKKVDRERDVESCRGFSSFSQYRNGILVYNLPVSSLQTGFATCESH